MAAEPQQPAVPVSPCCSNLMHRAMCVRLIDIVHKIYATRRSRITGTLRLPRVVGGCPIPGYTRTPRRSRRLATVERRRRSPGSRAEARARRCCLSHATGADGAWPPLVSAARRRPGGAKACGDGRDVLGAGLEPSGERCRGARLGRQATPLRCPPPTTSPSPRGESRGHGRRRRATGGVPAGRRECRDDPGGALDPRGRRAGGELGPARAVRPAQISARSRRVRGTVRVGRTGRREGGRRGEGGAPEAMCRRGCRWPPTDGFFRLQCLTETLITGGGVLSSLEGCGRSPGQPTNHFDRPDTLDTGIDRI